MTPPPSSHRNPRLLLVWGTLASVVSSGLFVWPLHLVQVSGQNGGLVLLVVVGWSAIIALLSPWHALGGLSGRIEEALNLIAGVLTVLIDALMLIELSAMMQTFYYFATPRFAFLLPLIALLIWVAAAHPEATLWRMVQLWTPILAVGSSLVLAVASTNIRHLRVLLPNQQIVIWPLIHGLFILSYLELPLRLTLRSIRPLLAETPAVAWRVAAAVYPWPFLMMFYLVAMGILGPAALVNVRWPLVFTLNHVTLDSTFFLSRIGIVVVFGWTVGVALSLMVHLRVVSMALGRWWRPGVAVLPYPVGLLWIVAPLLVPSPTRASTLLLGYLDPAAAVYLAVELLCLILWRVTGASRRRSAAPRLDREQPQGR